MSQGHVWNIPVAVAVENSAKSVKTCLHAQGTTSVQNVPGLQKTAHNGHPKKKQRLNHLFSTRLTDD